MDGEDKAAKKRKQRLRARREAEGMAQVSGWVPVDRRPYAREVLRAVAKGANSLPPDPELMAALKAAQEALAKAQAHFAAQEEVVQGLETAIKAVETERDAAKAAEVAEREKSQEAVAAAEAASKAAQEAQDQAVEALDRMAKAETAVQQVRSLSGVRGHLVRWLAGDVLE